MQTTLKTLLLEREDHEKRLKEYADMIENASEAIISITMDGMITHWNKAAENIFGVDACDVIGKNASELLPIFIPTELTAEVAHICAKAKANEKLIQFETIRNHKNGKRINVLLNMFPLKDKEQQLTGMSLFITDITQEKINEQLRATQYNITLALSESYDLHSAADGILKSICEIMDLQIGEIWSVDPSASDLRYVTSWVAQDTWCELEKISHNIRYQLGEGLPGYIWQINSPYWTSDLTKFPMRSRKVYLINKGIRSCFAFPITFQNEVMGIIVFFSEQIREHDANFLAWFTAIGNQIGTFIKRKRVEGDLLYIAEHDVLTGLANRFILEKKLNEAIAKACVQKKLVAILYLDLDNFKKINDTMGHSKGDTILQQVALRIKQCLRRDDVVSRFGGDEFTILLPKISDTKDVNMISKKIIKTIATPFMIDNHQFYITVSIGISIYPNDGEDSQTLLQNADMAMYRAKLNGHNNFQFCLPDMAEVTQEKIILEGELHRALKKNSFILEYQPNVNIKNNQILGVEALIRLNSSTNQIIMPDQFIKLAEDLNLITPINEWALRTACLEISKWQKQGFNHPIRVSVNISAQQFHSDLISIIKTILDEFDLSPNLLELELTEYMLLNMTNSNRALLVSLNELGVRLSIDDFGTGYSSFTYLKNIRIDTLKIDRSFITDLTHDAKSKAIVLAMINMATALKIKTVAEGVETQEQLEILKTMGCDAYQGFLFSRPVPAADLYQLIKSKPQ